MFKKVLTLMLVLLGTFSLVACGTDTPVDPVDELTVLEKLAEAQDQLDLPASASSDLTLLTSGLHDVVITWESSDETVIANDGTVTIPLNTEGDKTVTITATLTLDGQSFTESFDVTVYAATEMTDQEKADKAALAYAGLISGTQTSDLDLPATGQYEATVTWVSSNTDVLANDGTVTRPTFEEGNATVTLTGTVTVGTATAEVVFQVTIQAEAEVASYASIAEIYANAILDEEIEFTGIVTSTFNGGYFITDGTNVLGIYNGNNDLGAQKGDEVKVKGAYANYNSLYQLKPSSEEILSSGNAITITPTVLTVAELIALDSTDKTIHGKYYTITGTLALYGDYDNVVLTDGADQIMVYYQSEAASIAALEAEVGKEVTITVVYYTDHSRDGVIVAYDNGAEGIEVAALSDAEAVAADADAVEGLVPAATVTALTLPVEGPNGSTLAWTSSDATILGNDGALGTANGVATYTVVVTKGTETATVTVDVAVPMMSTVAEVLAMDLNSVFYVSGTVYEVSYYGFFIEQDGAYLFVYENGTDLVAGDNITFIAKLGTYNGLLQSNLIGDYTVNSQGNADVVVAVPGTVEGLENDLYPRGTRVTVTASLTIEGDYDNVYLNGAAGGKVVVYYRSNASELEALAGQTVTLTVVTYHDETVLYQLTAADVTTAATFDDAAMAQAVADGIDLGMLTDVNTDLVLPGDSTDPAYTIAWATTDAAVVTDAGVITMVSGDTPSATLTATVTVGTEVVTRDFVVTLMDLDENVPMTVAEALLLEDGGMVLVQGVITGFYYDERIIQDDTGAAIWVDSDVEGEMGDEIVVYGKLATYDSYGNDNRQLDNATKLETVSTGNDLVVEAETDVAAIFAEANLMKRYTATFTITVLNDYGNVLLNTVEVEGSPVNGFKFSASAYMPYVEDLYQVGDTIELTFTATQTHFDNIMMSNVVVPELTDAQALTVVQAALEVPATTTSDLTLPTEMYGVTISWASANAAIGVDGVVTQPAEGQPEATGDLTATLTIGTETPVDVVFPVTVPALQPAPAQDLFFSEYAEADGGSCKYVEVYNPTDATVDLSTYTIVKGGNGTAFDASSDIYQMTGTLAPGAVVVLGNSACTSESDAAQTVDNPFPTTGITWETTTVVGYVNGDDALGLFNNGVLIDTIGQNGEDPGSSWGVGNGNTTDGSTANTILIRVSSVTTGTADWSVGATQWVVVADDRDYTSVGNHTVDAE